MPYEVGFSISSEVLSKGLSIIFNVVQNITVNEAIEGQDLIELNNKQFSSLCKEMGGSKDEIKGIYTNNKSVVFSNNKLGFATSWTSYPLNVKFPSYRDGIEFTNYFRSDYFKTIAKLGTFNKSIKMSYVNDHIEFKSNIVKNTASKLNHLPEEYVGMISICIRSEPKKPILIRMMNVLTFLMIFDFKKFQILVGRLPTK